MSPAQTAVRSEGGGSSEVTRRVLITMLVFVVLIVLSMLLPRTLPGELSTGALTPHGLLTCRACPPTEQITGAGMAASEDGWYLNVQFAAPPLNTVLRVSFQGIPGEMELQRSGVSWRYIHPRPAGLPALTDINERDNRVVFGLPPTLHTNGFAVGTGSGDRIPESGFAAPTYPAAAHFNATDCVLLLILAVTGWYGYTRGFLLEIADLIAIVASLIVAALVYPPLAGMFAEITHSRTAGAVLGSGLLVLAVALVGVYLVRRFFAGNERMAVSIDPQLNGILGGATGCVRQLPLLAMLLAAGSNLAILHWAAPSINSSVLGTALVHAWKTLFSAG